MILDGLDAQGVLRSAICCLMLGDVVETGEGSGIVEGIHEDRSVTVRFRNESRRCLQRDCRVLEPARAMIPRVETTSKIMAGVLDWTGKVIVRAGGTLEKQVCHTFIPLPPAASSMEVIGGTLQVAGQDQGWGNTGVAGVHLRLKYFDSDDERAGADEYTVAKITYDHNRNKVGRYTVSFRLRLGLKTSSPIKVEVIVRTPNYPGWSAHACSVKLDLEVEEVSLETDSEEAWKQISMADDDAMILLWQRCGSALSQGAEGSTRSDTPLGLERLRLQLRWLGHLDVDLSHLSNSGLERQGILDKAAAISLADQKTTRDNVAKRLVEVLGQYPGISAAQRSGIARMSKVLLNAELIANSPSDKATRRIICDELLAMIFAILKGLEDHGDMAEFVVSSFAEAAGHCWTAWEEAVNMAHHVVCPDTSTNSKLMTADLEDLILGELLALRRDLAYRTFAKAKTIVGESDVHFKNFFFSSIHFGLPALQTLAARDPSRLNYAILHLIDMDRIRADLWATYTPQVIVEHVRGLIDSSTFWRERVVDWLRAHAVRGVDAETWLYEWCHLDYKIRDEAWVFRLASMHVLQSGPLCDIRPMAVPCRTAAQTTSPPAHRNATAPQDRTDRQPEHPSDICCSVM